MYIGNVTANDPVLNTSFYNTIVACVHPVSLALINDGVIRADSGNAMLNHFRNPEHTKEMASMYRQTYGVDPLTQNFNVDMVKNIMYAHVQQHQMQAQREMQMQSQMQNSYANSMGINNILTPNMTGTIPSATQGMYQPPPAAQPQVQQYNGYQQQQQQQRFIRPQVQQQAVHPQQRMRPQVLSPNSVGGANTFNSKPTFGGTIRRDNPIDNRFDTSVVEPIPDKTETNDVLFDQVGTFDQIPGSTMYRTKTGVVGIVSDSDDKTILSKLDSVISSYPKYIIKGASTVTKTFMHINKKNMTKYINIVASMTDKLDVVNDLYFYLHESGTISRDVNVPMVDNIAVTLVNESHGVITDKFKTAGIPNIVLEFENLREITQLCNGDGSITDDAAVNDNINYALSDDAFRADLKACVSLILLGPVKYTNIKSGKNCVEVDNKIPVLFTSADLSDVIPAFSRSGVSRVKLEGHVLNSFIGRFIGDYGKTRIHLNKSNLIKFWVEGEILKTTLYLKQ